MDYSKEASALFLKAMQLMDEGELSGAKYFFTHSLKCELRAQAYVQLIKIHLELKWLKAQYLINASLACAEFEGCPAILSELHDLHVLWSEKARPFYEDSEIKLAREWNLLGALEYFELSTPLIDKIMAACAPCIRLVPSLDPSGNSISKLGGVPFVPSGFDWPLNEFGYPLSFLCQLDFSEIPATAGWYFPNSGQLIFFYDNRDGQWGPTGSSIGWRVMYFDSSEVLVKAQFPKILEGPDRFLPCSIEFVTSLSFPSWDLEHLELSDDDMDSYLNFLGEWQSIGIQKHQLGGFPELIQNDWRTSGELGSNAKTDKTNDWELLLQIDSDDLTTFLWGDSGRLYFAIRSEDLKSRLFERTVLTMQCY